MPAQGKFPLLAGVLVAYAVLTLALVMYVANTSYTPASLGDISGDTKLPELQNIDDIATRKQAFIDLITPMVEQKNNALLEVRELLLQMQHEIAQGKTLSHTQKAQMRRLAVHYKLAAKSTAEPAPTKTEVKTPPAEQIQQLLKRVDIIPASMVVAQAAAESGWGTSRFAQQAQNLFGQWCYNKGCGLVPKRRAAGATHEVQKFASLEQAVNAYFHNINTHYTYQPVRAHRAKLRRAGEAISGQLLIAGLTGYSSRGQAYVDELAELIRYNKLDALEQHQRAP